MCEGVHGCAQVYTGVHMCVQVYIHVRGWVGACTYMYVGGCLCARVGAACAGVHGCVWKFAEVRGCL